jgi:tetratricopeptide (TPR) repeat protein
VTAYEKALQSLWLNRGDALALAREAVAAAPDSADARLLEAVLLVCSRDVRDFEAAGWAFARFQMLAASEGERAHAAALAAALDGDLAKACRIYDSILARDPADTLALWAAQLMDYYLGNAEALRARSASVLARSWPDMPGYHAVVSMHAFALQECGDYAQAEAAALHALELEPRDLRAEHAILHVHEMLGRPAEAMRFVTARSAQWGTSHHMWWHVALFMVALERPHAALSVYDRRLREDTLPELIDASALLWRLHLQEVDMESRFAQLAARWSPHAEDAHCAFNDLHAMMAFAGAQRWDLAERLLAAQERRLERHRGANRDMTRLVGHPACRALLAFGNGNYAEAERLLRALPPVAHRIGGSHAQRDVLQLTRAAAASLRSSSLNGKIYATHASRRLAAA